jgi:hypothetical protein
MGWRRVVAEAGRAGQIDHFVQYIEVQIPSVLLGFP